MIRRSAGATVLVLAASLAVASRPAAGQAPVGRKAAEALSFRPVDFHPPIPRIEHVAGVPVLFIEDHSLPLVTLFARFKGGYGRFPHSEYAAGSALPTLLRYGGTTTLSPDSVDELLEYYAVQTSFGGAGESVVSSMNTLTSHLDTAVWVWGEMLRDPGFDSTQVEVWRGQELEGVRRRTDQPQRLAFTEFNRLLYGDHPIGWQMEASDLTRDKLAPTVLRQLHADIVCPGNLTLGATGDASWDVLRPLLERLLAGWAACAEPLPPSPLPDIRRQPGVFVIPQKLDQSVIVMAHPTDVHLSLARDYFAAQIGNAILGGGGFSSRLMERVRTEEGYAYSASSLWTTPRRYDGLVGAVTRTSPANTVAAIKLILKTMAEMRDDPPTTGEVKTAVDQQVNGFVFNFEDPAQIVSRRMFYMAQDLPEDWLERYLRGIQHVTPRSVNQVFRKYLHPERMTILVVGDPDRIGRDGLASLGPVTILNVGPGG
ncbi:MAG: insulinase family protein [Gemmatimonadetes bacterium]|nr:insulinase family protein [Gemmatimonadota bacterium]